MSLPHGLFLNAFPVVCSGSHRLTRIQRPATRDERDELERSLGLRFWGSGEFLYAARELDLQGAEVVDVACGDNRDLHLYALKDALRDHAATIASDVWFGFGGVLHVVGLVEPTRHGRALSEVELLLRLTDEGLLEPETLLVARVRHRWSFVETLDTVALQPFAVSGSAIRTDGGTPARGEILRFEGESIIIRSRGSEVKARASDYRLRAGAALVRQVLGADTLFALQVASGSLAAGHRRNQAAIKDRFTTLERALEGLGTEFPLLGGSHVVIERDPVEVRLQQEM